MDTIRASTVAALGLVLLSALAVDLAAQSKPQQAKPQQAKPQARRPTAPAAQTADAAYTPALAEAEAALEKQDYIRAEALLKKVLAQDAQNYRALYGLSHVYAFTQRVPEAIDALRKSVALKPDFFESNVNLGMLLVSAGNKAEAIPYLRKATTLKPSHPGTAAGQLASAWMSLGWALEHSSPQEAVNAFRQAARLRPKGESLDAHLAASQVLLAQKNYPEAQKEYEQILEIRPQFSPALYGLTTALIEQKKFREAEVVLRRYVAAAPDNAGARMRLGQLLSADHRYEDALAEFSKVLELAPEHRDVKPEIAATATAAKKYDVAEKLYRELVQATPQDADSRLALGTVLMKQHKFPEAESELLQALKLDPKLAEGYGNLAIVAAENKHYQLALKALDARSQFMPEDAGSYFLRATCFDHLKAFPQASENYRKFLQVAEGKFPTQEWQARHRLIAIEPKK